MSCSAGALSSAEGSAAVRQAQAAFAAGTAGPMQLSRLGLNNTHLQARIAFNGNTANAQQITLLEQAGLINQQAAVAARARLALAPQQHNALAPAPAPAPQVIRNPAPQPQPRQPAPQQPAFNAQVQQVAGKVIGNDRDYPNIKDARNTILGMADALNRRGQNEQQILFFAKNVNDELLNKDDIDLQIKHVQRTIDIAKELHPRVEIKGPEYQLALKHRAIIYAFLEDSKGHIDNDGDYATAFARFKAVHPTVLGDGAVMRLNEDDRLFFLKRVIFEKLNVADVRMQIRHVHRTMLISAEMYPNPLVVGGKGAAYTFALEQREYLYKHLRSLGKDIANDAAFNEVFDKVADIIRVNPDAGLTLKTALQVKKLTDEQGHDLAKYFGKFEDHREALEAAAVADAHSGAPKYGHLVNLAQDNNNAKDEIGLIAAMKAADPIGLEYINLTYNDMYSAMFLRPPLPPIDAATFRNTVKVKAIGLVGAGFVGQQLINYQNKADADYERLVGIENQRPGILARVHALFTTVAEARVDPAIVRPPKQGQRAAVNYDRVKWENALKVEQTTMAGLISTTIEDCDDGVQDKVKGLESNFQKELGVDAPSVRVTESIATIVRKLKEQVLEDLKTHPGPKGNQLRYTNPPLNTIPLLHPHTGEHLRTGSSNADERNMYTSLVAHQRMRVAFSLGGEYEYVHYAQMFGETDKAQNAPAQIVRNFFQPNQPGRVHDAFPAVPVKPHLTLKGLVKAVFDAFETPAMLKDDIEDFIEGDLILLKERAKLQDDEENGNYENGVFLNLGPKQYPAYGNKQSSYSPALAFHMLEKLNYVKIDPVVKDQLYEFKFKDDHIKLGTINVRGQKKTLEGLIEDY